MNITKCRICGFPFDSSENYQKKEDLPDVYRCGKCRSVFLDTNDKEFKKIFSGVPVDQAKSKFGFIRYLLVKMNLGRVKQSFYYKWLKNRIDFRSINNVLDVGCQDGTLLNLLLPYGCRIEGYEPNIYNAHYSKVKQFIHNDYFLIDSSIKNKYDLIILGQCIYYFYDGIDLLRYVDSLLTDKGKIFIAATNTMHDDAFYNIKEHAPTILSNKIIEEFFTNKNYIVTTETFAIIQPGFMPRIKALITKIFQKKIIHGMYLQQIIEFITAKIAGVYKNNNEGYHQFILVEKK